MTPSGVIEKYTDIRGETLIDLLDLAGYVIVPKEPTRKMLCAVDDIWLRDDPLTDDDITRVWGAMIRAHQ